MFENQEVVNTPEIEARIKKLENELKSSKEEIIQCEKDKKNLVSVIEKLQEKFMNNQLDSMISKLESNVLLFDKAVETAKRNVCKDKSTNLSIANGKIVDDRQRIESAPNSVTDLLTKVSEALHNIRNDDLSSSSSDDENNTDSEQSDDDNEPDLRSGDVLEKVTVSLNRLQNWVDQMRNSADKDKSDPSIKNNSKCDEVFTISDEEDSVQFDFQSVAHPKASASAVIELTDSEDCLLLSETSDNESSEKTDQPQRNDFSGLFKKTTHVEKDLPVQPDVKIDASCGENSNNVCSKTNQQQQKFSDVLQKPTTRESDGLPAEIGKESELLPSDGVKKEVLSTTSQKGTPFSVLLKPVLSESGDVPSLAGENDSPQNDNSNKVSFSKTNQNSKKPADSKSDTLPIPVDEEDILLQTDDDSDEIIFSEVNPKKMASYRNSQNRVFIRPDLSLTPADKEDNLLQNCHSNDATYQKVNRDKISISEDEEDFLLRSDDSNNAVYPKINPERKSFLNTSQNLATVKSDVSFTPVHKEDNSLKNNLSNESTYQKSNHDKISFSGIFQKTAGVEFGDSSTRMSTNAELSLDKSIKAECSKIKKEVEVRAKFDDSSTQIGAEVNLSQSGKSRKKIVSVEGSQISPVVDYSSDSSTQSCEIVELFKQKDLPRNSTSSKFNNRGESSSHVLKRKDSCESDSLSTPPIPRDDLLGSDDSNEAEDSKMIEQSESFLRLLKRQMPDVEQDAKYEMDARKRFKYELYASYSSRSSSLRSSPSLNSFEEMRRRNRLPVWPCPVCEECFGDPFNLSRHLNNRHFGEEGVCSCSICGFVTPSVNSHKRHVNKYHGNAFLVDNRK
ncbi:uncharacterized protein LOC135835658 isoform X2 [Planococcus citri]|uniref:uncharacterized protein LOC135835658 isoform X2 n=1 Tax=Planococcus citri TaxID=170843 RepID=UPI0031F7B0E8